MGVRVLLLAISFLRMTSVPPAEFGAVTTKQVDYKPFGFVNPPKSIKPKQEIVSTSMQHGHYETTAKKEFKRMEYRQPAVDLIPYP